MHHADLILTLTGGLTAALALGYLTHRLGLSPIVGYLLAGFAVGPLTPGFVANKDVADQLAEVGVILLMFGVGLEFHLKELLQVRRVAIPGAVIQSLVATALGCLVGWVAGWEWSAGLVFGLAISVASTVVLLRVLADNHDLHTPTGHIAVGWLVVEDLLTVLVLVLLPAVFKREPGEGDGLVYALFLSIVKLSVLVGFTFVVGGRLIPWILGHVAASRSRELFTLTILVTALGIAVGSSIVFGASMALGAFLAGMVVGQSDFSYRAASEALPMRDAFAVIFFVSVGMLFDPVFLIQAPLLVTATVLVVLVGKPLTALGIVTILGYPPRVALAVAVALAQIGEFSFILAGLGKELGILPPAATNALVAAAIVSISVNPILYRLIGPLETWLKGRPRLWKLLETRPHPDTLDSNPTERTASDASHRAVVVGYGPLGRTVVRLLQENDIAPVVVEMNLETVRQLRADGIEAVYGDAALRETLKGADIAHSFAIILSASGLKGSEEVIRLAKEINPRIHVSARTGYLREIEPLRKAGADSVFAGEGEVALTLTESLLRLLGATDEQIDREKDRIRRELFERPEAGPNGIG